MRAFLIVWWSCELVYCRVAIEQRSESNRVQSGCSRVCVESISNKDRLIRVAIVYWLGSGRVDRVRVGGFLKRRPT